MSRGSDLVYGTLIVATAEGATSSQCMTRDTIETHDGWMIDLEETRDHVTVYFVAELALAGEAACLVGRCPIEDYEVGRAAFAELLRSARPEWPDTALLSELLELPDVDC